MSIFSLPNYRWYFAGQLVSLGGSWAMQTAIIWLVYQLTHSAFQVGLIAFVGQAPALLLSPLAGVWIDRLDRVKVLLVTQSFAVVHSLLLGLMVFTGHASWVVLAIFAVLQGLISAFDLPARQVLAFMLAEKKEHLSAIISMNSSLVNLGRLGGPTLAGVIIAAYGAAPCFAVGAVGYLAVIGSIAAMRLPRSQPHRSGASVWKEMAEGFHYVLRFRFLLALLLVSAGTSVFGLAVFTLMPAYAEEILDGGGHTLGLLMSAFSAGAAVSGFYLACRSGTDGLRVIIPAGHFLAGLTLLVFAFSSLFPLSMVCLFLMGIGGVMVVAPSNTLLQSLVEERKRGRVMSLYGLTFQGGIPIGALMAGALAQWIGLAWTAWICGLACLAAAGLFWAYTRRLEPRDDTAPSLPQEVGVVPVLPPAERA